jgi:tetratricopeptide (TPR) repeat protein
MGRFSRLLVFAFLAFALLLLFAQNLLSQQSAQQPSLPIPDYASQLSAPADSPSRTPGTQASATMPDRALQSPVQPAPLASPDSLQRVPPPPENATAVELEQQGDTLRGEKAYLDAMDYYHAAAKKADSAVLHNKMGIALFLLRRDAEAKKEYERSIHLNKEYAEPHNNLGALYSGLGKIGSAVKEYKRAIKLSDGNAVFHKNLGTAYFRQKDFEATTREYTRAMQLDPSVFDSKSSGGVSVNLITSNDIGHFHYVMAQMYGQKGDSEHCRYYLSKANEEGYPIRYALHDNEFAALRKDPNFVTFVRSLKPPPPVDSNN